MPRDPLVHILPKLTAHERALLLHVAHLLREPGGAHRKYVKTELELMAQAFPLVYRKASPPKKKG